MCGLTWKNVLHIALHAAHLGVLAGKAAVAWFCGCAMIMVVGLLAASSALAADPVVILRDDGTYVLQPNSTTLVKVTVVDQRTGSTPPPDPTPPPATPLSQKVATWAKETSDPSGVFLIEGSYQWAIDNLSNGKIPPNSRDVDASITNALNQACDLLDQNPAVPKLATTRRVAWRSFRDKVADEWVLRINKDGDSKATHLAFFGDVVSGLKVSHAGEAIPDWLQAILQQLLQLLLQWLLGRFGG